jgi:hypothetical protein
MLTRAHNLAYRDPHKYISLSAISLNPFNIILPICVYIFIFISDFSDETLCICHSSRERYIHVSVISIDYMSLMQVITVKTVLTEGPKYNAALFPPFFIPI